MKRDRSCGNCVFLAPHEGELQCRRHAPRPLENPDEGDHWTWAATYTSLWCGEHQTEEEFEETRSCRST